MTIYETLHKRARPISIAAGVYFAAIIAAKIMVPKDKFQLVSLGLLIIFGVLVWLTGRTMQCARCKKSLGLLVFHAGKSVNDANRVMNRPDYLGGSTL